MAHTADRIAEHSTDYMTAGDLAVHFGRPEWQIRRLWERDFLPTPKRIGAYRVVHRRELPAVRAALVRAGYLPEGVPA